MQIWLSHDRRRQVAGIATFLIAIAICILTLIPMPTVASAVPGSDKLHHIVAFAALTGPTALLFRPWVIRVFFGALLLGALIEIVQPFVGRTASLTDFYADCAGAIFGVIIGTRLRCLLEKQQDH